MLYCDPCNEINGEATVHAVGYCIDCRDCLCTECYAFHLRVKPFRNHILQDKDQMPKAKPQPPIGTSTTVPSQIGVTEQCQKHNIVLTIYCKTHEFLGCQSCKDDDHNECDIVSISAVAAGVHKSAELRELGFGLNKLRQTYWDNLQLSRLNMKDTANYSSKAYKKIQQIRQEFDQLQKATEDKVKRIEATDKEAMENVASACTKMLEQIALTSTELDTLNEAEHDEKLFIAMKRTQEQRRKMNDVIGKLEETNKIHKYTVVPDKRLSDIMGRLQDIGEVVVNEPGTPAIFFKCLVPDSQKSISTRIDEDYIGRNIQSSAILPGEKMIVCDWTTDKLMLVDLPENKVLSEYEFDAVTIVAINNNTVAVTTKEKVQLFTISPANVITMDKEIAVPTESFCRGIDYNDQNNTLLVSTDCGLFVIDLNTSAVRKLEIKDEELGYKTFGSVAFTPDKTSVYLCDGRQVTLMSMQGEILGAIEQDLISEPKQIAVSKTGIVFIASEEWENIFQVLPGKLDNVETIYAKNIGTQPAPVSISYSDREDKLYIGHSKYTTMTVIELQDKASKYV